MKVKPKEVLVNLPVALLFDESWEIVSFAANVNTILHGKVKLKVEELGVLGGRTVGIFYLERNNEYHEIRDEFVRLIEQEEVTQHNGTAPVLPSMEDEIAEQYDEKFGDNKLCLCGHPYYRHFDTYEQMSAVGCKYCSHYTPMGNHVKERFCPYFKEDKGQGIVRDPHGREEDLYAHAVCNDCDELQALHIKGLIHCRCGEDWVNGKCSFLMRGH